MIGKIENEDICPETETEALEFYKDFKKKTGLSEKWLGIITNFSWSQEDKYTGLEYCCHAWMIIVCVLQMIDLNKE